MGKLFFKSTSCFTIIKRLNRIFLIKHIYYLRREEEKRKECFCKNNLCHNLYSIVIVEIFMKEFDLGRRPHFLSFTFLVHCHYITGFDMSYV